MSSSELTNRLGSLVLAPTHKIIVGVDYGTTYTGASYVSTKGKADLDNIILINSWPGPTRDTETVLKTPSRIAYPVDNPRISKQRWGYQVEPGIIAYSWTKLLLDENTPLTKYDDATLDDSSGAGILKLPKSKTAVDVVSNYLSEVYNYILKTIAKQITEEALSVTPLEFWFTVPAIWSDQAQSATRTAAWRAGFGNREGDHIFMISEPEAAAIAALKKYTTKSMGGSVKPGDGVLVCDCGGGTVVRNKRLKVLLSFANGKLISQDITTYLVEATQPELTFEELCTGIAAEVGSLGGKCGSTAVDRNLYQLMSDRFGDAFDSLPMKRKGPGSEFMKNFEVIKRDFGNSDEERIFELPINMAVENPNPEHFDDEERMILLHSDDLRSIFDPVVDQILSLVRRQIKDATAEVGRGVINRVILAGGFGDSEYLREAFRKAFFSTDRLIVTVPDNPQAAIVQGAALCGLQGLRSTAKKCRRHYGTTIGIPFRRGIDSEFDSYVDPFSGEKLASGIMEWIIAKGEKYSENHSCTVSFYRSHRDSSGLKFYAKLYSCDSNNAPERVDDPGVRCVGRICTDLTGVDLGLFDCKYNATGRVYRVEFDLKVVFGAREGLLKFETICQGKVIGRTSIDFSTTKFY